MKLFLLPLFLLVLAVGCTANDPDPPAEQSNEQQEEGIVGDEKGEQHTTDELLTDSREEVDMADDTISITEAESLVNEHLNIDPQSNTIVVFDSELENGDYLIHVDHLTKQNNDSDHHAIEGWYTVNPRTREINEYKQK